MISNTVAPPTLDASYLDRFRKPASLGNPVRDLNPLVLLACAVLLAVVTAMLPELVGSAAVCLAAVVLAFLGGVGRRFVSVFARLVLAVGGFLFVVRVIFAKDADTYWSWGPFGISPTSITEAAGFTVFVLAMCAILTLFFAFVPIRHLMLALEDVGVHRKASYIVLASFQAITDLGANVRTVLDAQKSRGVETEGSIVRRAGAFLPVLAPVFLSAMSQTEERALALDARAFNVSSRHSQFVFLRRPGITDWAVLGGMLVLTVGSIIGKVLLWH
ncbi:hypothetical protein CFK38_16890 [Brachybacterium vulturis]|uniref:Energy-coupling factor transporter transmembrane protein EcfT n=1 Tax=Brachybacterium vulturis TaxID=2017484 RepID=A0A291GSM2_9MICO|nr:energy-coupling factor transporter transmembrane component T [Brachybacterium vulturis]ATG53006.1 hypothetical protein CFK38_16890 [Brachybacterium vulturis]